MLRESGLLIANQFKEFYFIYNLRSFRETKGLADVWIVTQLLKFLFLIFHLTFF